MTVLHHLVAKVDSWSKIIKYTTHKYKNKLNEDLDIQHYCQNQISAFHYDVSLYLSIVFLNFKCVLLCFNWWLLLLCNCDGVSREFDCVCREAVQRSKEVIMASISEHIQNEFSKWQELQRRHDVKTSVSNSMVWFDFPPSQLWLRFWL